MRELERDARDEIAAVGGIIEREERGRHIKIWWRLNSCTFFQTISRSPSCRRASLNLRASIRRQARTAM